MRSSGSTPGVLVELERRQAVAGQENWIVDVAVDAGPVALV